MQNNAPKTKQAKKKEEKDEKKKEGKRKCQKYANERELQRHNCKKEESLFA
jgi:hypothetical protein